MVASSSSETPPMGRPRKKPSPLPPCVYHRHGAYWYVKAGKWTRLGSDLSTSLAAYARIVQPGAGNGMAQLIRAAMPFVLNTPRKGKPIARSTRKQYLTAQKLLETTFAEYEPEQVTPKEIRRFKRGMADRQVMFNTALSVLRQIFEYATEEELVDSNPVASVHGYKRDGRDRLLSDAEFAAIYAKASHSLQCMMDLWRLTGQRVMEVARIGERQLEEDGIAFVQQKTGAKVLVVWTSELRAVVDRAKGLNGNVRSLTLFRGPPTYHQVNDEWRAAVRASGIENAQARDLRAVSATEAQEQGLDPQKLLGHTTEAMTRKYLRGRKTAVVLGPSFGQRPNIGQKK